MKEDCPSCCHDLESMTYWRRQKNEETFEIEVEIRNDKKRQIISPSHRTLVWYVITWIVRDYSYPDVKMGMQAYFMVSEITYET